MTSLTESIPVAHPVVFSLDHSKTKDLGKVRSDLGDIEVLYYGTSGWTVLGRGATPNSADFSSVTFNTYAAFPSGTTSVDQYYVYYGNRYLAATPSRPAYDDNSEWPIEVDYNEPGITYTNPGIHWIDGVARVKGAKATFIFNGDQVRWIAATGNSFGKAGVQLDNGLLTEVDLFTRVVSDGAIVYLSTYSSTYDKPTLVAFTATDLAEGEHSLTVTVKGKRNPSAFSATIQVLRFDYRKNVIVVDLGEEIDPTFTWGSTVLPGV